MKKTKSGVFGSTCGKTLFFREQHKPYRQEPGLLAVSASGGIVGHTCAVTCRGVAITHTMSVTMQNVIDGNFHQGPRGALWLSSPEKVDVAVTKQRLAVAGQHRTLLFHFSFKYLRLLGFRYNFLSLTCLYLPKATRAFPFWASWRDLTFLNSRKTIAYFLKDLLGTEKQIHRYQ